MFLDTNFNKCTMYFIRVMIIDQLTNTFFSDNIIILLHETCPKQFESSLSSRKCQELGLLAEKIPHVRCSRTVDFESVVEPIDRFIYKNNKGASWNIFPSYTLSTILNVKFTSNRSDGGFRQTGSHEREIPGARLPYIGLDN